MKFFKIFRMQIAIGYYPIIDDIKLFYRRNLKNRLFKPKPHCIYCGHIFNENEDHTVVNYGNFLAIHICDYCYHVEKGHYEKTGEW